MKGRKVEKRKERMGRVRKGKESRRVEKKGNKKGTSGERAGKEKR